MTRSLALVIVLIATGCTSRTPVTFPVVFDCKHLKMTRVTNPDLRVHSYGFSILPPKGEHWCGPTTETRTVLFSKSALLGRVLTERPQMAERRHMFVAMASAVEVEGETIKGAAELQQFVERWLRGGGIERCAVGDKCVLSNVQSDRFKHVESKVVLDKSLGPDCVRFDATTEERGNPTWRQAVVITKMSDNILCLHPHSSQILIWVRFFEKYAVEAGPKPLLARTVKKEALPFLRSVIFTQVK